MTKTRSIARYLKVPAGAVLAGAFVLLGCDKQQAPMGAMERPPAPVVTAQAVTRDVPVYIHEIGKCAALETVTILPQVAGKVTDVRFTDGTDVKKGQDLFTIDPRPYKAAMDQAQAMLNKDKAVAENARVFAERQQKVFNEKSISAADYDQARFARDAALANATADEAALETAKLNYEYCFIKSPIDGRAGQRMVDAGNVMKANEGTLLVIQRMDPIYVEFNTDEKNLPVIRDNMARGTLRARVGMPGDSIALDQLQVTFPTESSELRDGQLTFLDNTVKDTAGTIKLRVTVDNKDRHFWPGQFLHVWLVLETKKDAVLVPSVALQIGQAGQFVFVVKDDKVATIAEQRPIKAGQRQGDDMVVVEQGVAAGETVVVDGQLGVTPGGKVHATNPPPPAAATAGDFHRATKRQEASRESLRALYSPAGDDPAPDGLGHPVRRAGVPPAAGERSAGGGLSGHHGEGRLSRRKPADDGEQRRHAARAAVHADPRAGAGDLARAARAYRRFTLQFALNKSIDAAATDVQTAITQAHGQPAGGSARRRRRSPRPIPTISRSCTSR